MKKVLCLLLAMIMCISLVACGGGLSEDTETSEVAVDPVEVAVDPVEEAKAKLSAAYNSYCKNLDSDCASLGYDEKSLTIDTNPDNNEYSGDDEDAISAIFMVNAFLGLPSSLIDKMSSTRALDGMQSQNYGDYTVTWNYHPDNGMKVIYEVNP